MVEASAREGGLRPEPYASGRPAAIPSESLVHPVFRRFLLVPVFRRFLLAALCLLQNTGAQVALGRFDKPDA